MYFTNKKKSDCQIGTGFIDTLSGMCGFRKCKLMKQLIISDNYKTSPCSVLLYLFIALVFLSVITVEATAEPDLLKRQFNSPLHMRDSSSKALSQTNDNNPIQPQCNIKCKSLKPRRFCGSDGKVYLSKCELRKVIKCEKKNIKIVSRGRCGVNRLSRGNNDHNCTSERNKLLASRANRQSTYIPTCRENGSYEAVQCYVGESKYCWCVTPDGKPVPRTSVKDLIPDCNKECSAKTRRGRTRGSKDCPVKTRRASKKKCSRKDRVNFTTNLVQLFVEDYSRSTPVPANGHQAINVILWKYIQLDKNKDDLLKSKELQSLRKMVRKMVKPKSCAKRFPKYCDEDKNNIISKKEWSTCISDSVNNDKTGSPNSKEANGSKVDVRGALGTSRKPDKTSEGGIQLPSLSSSRDNHKSALSFLALLGAKTQAGPTLLEKQTGVELPVTQGRTDMPETQPSSLVDCFEARRQEEDNEKKHPNGQIFVPECVEGGLYKKDQCHKYTGYCWCVDEYTGKPIPGYSTKNESPDCSQAKPERELKGQADNQPLSNRRPIPGCPYPQKRQYLTEVLDTLSNKMVAYSEAHPEAIVMNPNHTLEETAVRWKFKMLDTNKNKQLDRKETKSIKKGLKTSIQSQGHTKLRKCARNFLRYCDENKNGKISISEWVECLRLNEISRHESANNKRKGTNPLTHYLKS